MPIDEVKFGELIGTVGALANTVQNMQNAIIPALRDIRQETQRFRDEARERQEKHEQEDSVIHTGVADCLDWMRGDGTPENIGARNELNRLVLGKAKFIGIMTGIAVGAGAIGNGIGSNIGKIWASLTGG